MSTRLKAILQALFVTVLWATSWVLIKWGLEDVPPLLFAGLRYASAAVILLIVWLFSPQRNLIKTISAKSWQKIVLVGIFYYALVQGAQFLGLKDLPAVTVNLILGCSTIVTALLGVLVLKEHLSITQWMGVLLTPVGAYLYFFPITLLPSQWNGIVIVFFGMLAGSIGVILSREMNRENYLPPLTLTTISMLIGGFIMLAGGLITEGWSPLPFKAWLIILWMAVVNTAFAFTLWNHILRTLTAAESSAINNSLMVQIPILAIIFLGETVSPRQVLGMVMIIAGVVMVQLLRKKAAPRQETSAGS